ncbi:unnamed protein product [Pylaiella littoralis]
MGTMKQNDIVASFRVEAVLHVAASTVSYADGALQGAAGKGIKALHGQIMGVVSTQMWGEFDGAVLFALWFRRLLVSALLPLNKTSSRSAAYHEHAAPRETESGTGDLEMILMGMDTGTLGVARLTTGHLICVYAEAWVQMGSVRTRLLSLRSALEISLRSLEGG